MEVHAGEPVHEEQAMHPRLSAPWAVPEGKQERWGGGRRSRGRGGGGDLRGRGRRQGGGDGGGGEQPQRKKMKGRNELASLLGDTFPADPSQQSASAFVHQSRAAATSAQAAVAAAAASTRRERRARACGERRVWRRASGGGASGGSASGGSASGGGASGGGASGGSASGGGAAAAADVTPPTDTAPPDEAELLEIARAIAEADAKERRGGRREISNLIEPGKVAEILKPTLGGRLEARAARVIAETRKAGELAEAGGRGGGGGKGKGKAGRGGGGELQGGRGGEEEEEEEETEEERYKWRCMRENQCMKNRLCTRGYRHRGPCPEARGG